MEVCIDTVDGQHWVVKSASSPAETAHLRREAEQLRKAAHPGVVELGSFHAGPPVELRTRHAGRSLAEMAPLAPAELCGLGAAVATVLADLHDLGIVHGAIAADHILIGAEGRPVLCGFSSSGSTTECHAGGDVIDLADTLASRLGPEAPRRLRRLLLGPGKGLRHTPSARAFAAALSQAVPDRRLPTAPAVRPPSVSVGVEARPTAPAEPASSIPGSAAPIQAPRGRSAPASGRHLAAHPARRRVLPKVAAVVALGGAVAVAAIVVLGPDRHPAAAEIPCPSADQGCRPVPVRTGAFAAPSGTFTIAVAHPIVVLGRWRCGPASLPAALDPRTGQVWAWLSWAGPATTVTAEAVGRHPGAVTLRVVPEASGCDRLEVIDARGAATIMIPGANRDA